MIITHHVKTYVILIQTNQNFVLLTIKLTFVVGVSLKLLLRLMSLQKQVLVGITVIPFDPMVHICLIHIHSCTSIYLSCIN